MRPWTQLTITNSLYNSSLYDDHHHYIHSQAGWRKSFYAATHIKLLYWNLILCVCFEYMPLLLNAQKNFFVVYISFDSHLGNRNFNSRHIIKSISWRKTKLCWLWIDWIMLGSITTHRYKYIYYFSIFYQVWKKQNKITIIIIINRKMNQS